MAVLERSELEASPLADLHAIADQVGLDGFRRLRKADLIDTILDRMGGGEEESVSAPASAIKATGTKTAYCWAEIQVRIFSKDVSPLSPCGNAREQDRPE